MSHDNGDYSYIKKLIQKVTSPEFDRINFDCINSVVPEKCLEVPCILGVDEAGRGPVLGPMVYGVCYCSAVESDLLKSIGCADSKALTEKKREEIFEEINVKEKDLGWAVDVISPNFISNNMQKKVKCSLNEIAMNSTIKLIESVFSAGVNVQEIYVDTIGPPEKYQAKLIKLFPQCKITVEKKADSLYPIVGAASICAKVIRDIVIQNWKFPELINIMESDFGTGYPGDPKSKQFLSDKIDNIFGFPHLVRFSWSTAGKFLEDIAEVEWEEVEDDASQNQSIASFFKPVSSTNKHKTEFSFFKERLLNATHDL